MDLTILWHCLSLACYEAAECCDARGGGREERRLEQACEYWITLLLQLMHASAQHGIKALFSRHQNISFVKANPGAKIFITAALLDQNVVRFKESLQFRMPAIVNLYSIPI